MGSMIVLLDPQSPTAKVTIRHGLTRYVFVSALAASQSQGALLKSATSEEFKPRRNDICSMRNVMMKFFQSFPARVLY
jgi:hypothetical protein